MTQSWYTDANGTDGSDLGKVDRVYPDGRRQPMNVPETLPEAKLYIQQQIVSLAYQKQESLGEGYPPTEKNEWGNKEQQSAAFLATGDITLAKYVKIEAIANTGAQTEPEIYAATKFLAEIIVAKADELRTVGALISGTRARKWAEVEAMDDVQQVLDYPVEEGWAF